MDPRWLTWAKELQAIAQSGLTYATDVFDRGRYQALRDLAARIMAEGSGADPRVVRKLFEGQVGHGTPKIDLRGAVFRDGRILLLKELSDGRWSLPGGWAEVNLSPAEGLAKEIAEEAGLSAKVTKLAAVYDRSKHPHVPPHPFHCYKLFYLAEIFGGSPEPGVETSEVAFFAEDEMPELSVGRVLPYQIRRMFEHHRHPELPTDFD